MHLCGLDAVQEYARNRYRVFMPSPLVKRTLSLGKACLTATLCARCSSPRSPTTGCPVWEFVCLKSMPEAALPARLEPGVHRKPFRNALGYQA